jgi:cell filamentation protein
MTKYDASGAQASYEPGSNDLVLKNKLGIILPQEMDDAELVLLQKLYQRVLINQLPSGTITIAQIKGWHRSWLGNIYAWGGVEREVNISKDGFQFAAAAQIPRLLQKLETDYLAKLTPCAGMDDQQLVEAIATVHVEFILVHPFREGNGRLSRLLADVMAVQAGFGPLDYSAWDDDKSAYIAAIHAGLAGDYQPMMNCVEKAFTAI